MAAGEILPGLRVRLNVITEEEERRLIEWLDTRPWTPVNRFNPHSRRVQEYGAGYGYDRHRLTSAPPMEGMVAEFATWLGGNGYPNLTQCIVNEYFAHQGISAHTDSSHFGSEVLGLSIGADASIIFRKGESRIPVFLPRRSLMIMVGEARTEWTHEIPATQSYLDSGCKRIKKSEDYRRISLTFRSVARS